MIIIDMYIEQLGPYFAIPGALDQLLMFIALGWALYKFVLTPPWVY